MKKNHVYPNPRPRGQVLVMCRHNQKRLMTLMTAGKKELWIVHALEIGIKQTRTENILRLKFNMKLRIQTEYVI